MTLRLRLTLLYGACFLVAGAALLAITYGLVAQQTTRESGVFVARGTQLSLPSPGAGAFMQAVTAQGKVTVRAQGGASATAPSPPARLLNQLQKSGQTKIDQVVRQADVALRLQRSQSLSALLTKSGVALAIMALLSIGLGYLMAGRALRPLRTMNHRARAITEDSLHERLGIEPRSDELGELASTFDALLARLERAFESQRRFVANASHELRTPVTLERALVEVALADRDATVDSLRGTCRRVLAATDHQERVIEALLTLARSQAGVEGHEIVDLADLVKGVLASRQSWVAGITVAARLDPAPIRGDRPLLERMVANLLDNAVIHNAVDDPWLRVQTGSQHGIAGLRIANGGVTIPRERVDELFEPFRRLGGERTSGGGLGLGLSIVKAIAQAHGGAVDAQPLQDGGLELWLSFTEVAVQRLVASAGPEPASVSVGS